MISVLLGLGSNVEREKHLVAALDELAGIFTDMRCSAVFESLAVGYKGDNFYNLVVAGLTSLPVLELDRRLKLIEADNGRYAPDRRGLPLDIDILVYGDQVGSFGGLVLPRPEILKNAFVLWPLALLVPQLEHPLAKMNFADLWQAARFDQGLWPVPFQWQGMALTPQSLIDPDTPV